MFQNTPHHSALIMLVFILSGCLQLPAHDQRNSIDLSHQYNTKIETKVTTLPPVKSGWWTLYEDEELNTLMRQAFAKSPNLNQIRARLDQANARVKQNQSTRLPTLNISGDRSTLEGDNAPSSDYSLIGTASFELDLWGKNRANHKSAKLEAQASAEDLHTAI